MTDTLPAPAHSRHNSVNPQTSRDPGMRGLTTVWCSRAKKNPNPRIPADFGHPAGGLVHQRGSSEGATMSPERRRRSDVVNRRVSSENFAGVPRVLLLTVNPDGSDDPFSDENEVGRNPPLSVGSSPSNPFTDMHAVDNHRSLQRPQRTTTSTSSSPATLHARGGLTPYTRSNVRSDQFDLEIDERNGSISTIHYAAPDVPKIPPGVAGTPSGDRYISRVGSWKSSGASLDGWGEPGPDVGSGTTTREYQSLRESQSQGLAHIGKAI